MRSGLYRTWQSSLRTVTIVRMRNLAQGVVGFWPLLGAIRIPVPNPVREPNRCNLEPFRPETPETTLYLVLAQGLLTLQVVCFGLAHFQLPVRPPEIAFPADRWVCTGLRRTRGILTHSRGP